MFLVLMYLDPYGWVLKLSIERLEITTMWSLFQFVFLSWMCVEGGCKVPARHCSRADTKWMGSCIAVWLQARNFPANWKLLKGEGDAMVRKGDLGSVARRYYPVFSCYQRDSISVLVFMLFAMWRMVKSGSVFHRLEWQAQNLKLSKLGEKWCWGIMAAWRDGYNMWTNF